MWLDIRNKNGWRRQWQPTPVLLPGESHGWRSLVGHGVTQSQTRSSDFTFTFHFHALEKEMATHSSVLAWRILGTEEPGGLPSLGSHRVGHDWSNLAAAAAAILKTKPASSRWLQPHFLKVSPCNCYMFRQGNCSGSYVDKKKKCVMTNSHIEVWRKESEVTQSCPTLCNPIDCSPPGSSIHGIF